MKYIKSDINETIVNFRKELYTHLTAPIDAMWELLYISFSQHYIIQDGGRTIGYFCVNEDNSLIQLYVNNKGQIKSIVSQLIEQHIITKASLSTNEPLVFNACLELSTNQKVNTYCFQHSGTPIELSKELNIETVTEAFIPTIKAYLKEQVGMDDTFGYTENLVKRKEMFMLRENDTIIATSECRISDTQANTADLGIIVNKAHYGQGIATQVMKQQVNRVLQLGRQPICSTTYDNVASKKALEKAGFYCSNIIFDISLES